MPMLAHFDEQPLQDRRRTVRRSLRLGVSDSGGQPVTIHDLSLTGALLETSAPMLVGSMFEVELPQGGRIEAAIVWNSGEYYGCQFELPIAPSVLSAALLQAAPRPAQGAPSSPDPLMELQELNAEVEELAWKMEQALKRLSRK
jgi:PilZ domain